MNEANFVRDSIKYLEKYSKISLQEQASKYGFTAPQTKVIREVIKKRNTTITELCKELSMSQSTVSDIVERLTIKGILLKQRNKNDKRFYVINISDEVELFLEKHSFDFKNQAFEKVLENISDSDKEIVLKGLEILVKSVELTNNSLERDYDI